MRNKKLPRRKFPGPAVDKVLIKAVRKPRPVHVLPHYLDRREAAVYLGIGPEKFTSHVRTGEIPEIVLAHSCRRYSIADLDAFAATKRRIKR